MLLALDTSVDIAVALVDPAGAPAGAGPLAQRRVREQRRHAELLAPLVADVLAEAGVERAALTRVVVGTGPAPFTGLRAGLVTARTFAFALGIPVLGVCSHDALAAQAFRDGAAADGQEVVTVTDARRREVHWARYRTGADVPVVQVVPPHVEHPADLAARLGDAVVVGPGAVLHATELRPAVGGPTWVEPAVLAAIALARESLGVEQPAEPLYLRRPDVTPSVARKRATG